MSIFVIPYEGEVFKETRKSYFLKSFGEEIRDMRIISFGKCNYSCPYCKRGGFNKVNEIISGSVLVTKEELFKAVAAAVSKDEIVRLSGGDPVCYPDISIELLRYAKSIGGQTSIAHNGSGTEFVKKCVEQNLLDSISVDFKASSPEILAKVAGLKQNVSEIMWNNNVKTLRLLREFSEVKTDIRTCVFDDTEYEELLKIGNIIKANSNENVFWTLRCYSVVQNYSQTTVSTESMKELAKSLSKAIPNLKIGIRVKWDMGAFFYYLNGYEIDRVDTDKVRKKSII